MRKIFFVLLLISCSFLASSQQKYWIYFTDKHGVDFDPYSYFEPAAIERRVREGIDLCDPSDFPLREDYFATISAIADSICGASRWFNAVACVANDEQLRRMNDLYFVKNIEPMSAAPVLCSSQLFIPDSLEAPSEFDQVLAGQTERMQYSLLKAKGFTGKNVRVAVFDAGFNGFLGDEAFLHLITGNNIKATYDFVRNKKFVFGNHNHGTHVTSCIAGLSDGKNLGCATDADFLLARTEQAMYESRIEEENWVESLEWADKWGAEIVNSSLGYTRQFYFRHDMDGKTSLITRAANTAMSKGILVVNSAGNEGQGSWEIIGVPADADSVLTIGGIDPETGFHSGYSSYGPTTDLRLKPNLCAFFNAVVTDNNNMKIDAGTSFSSPLVAGFAACIRQMHPEWTVRKLFDELQKSGDLYPYFDYAHGYGVPQASYFMKNEDAAVIKTFTLKYNGADDSLELVLLPDPNDTVAFSIKKEIWKKTRNYSAPLDYIYMHLESTDHVISSYDVLEPADNNIVKHTLPGCMECIIRVHYKGYTIETTKGKLLRGDEEDR